jgi:hypothetical protein
MQTGRENMSRKNKQLAGMAIGAIAMLAVAAPALTEDDSEGPKKDEVFTVSHVIQVGTTPFFSFDISWVDPVRNKYYLADRNNKAIEVIDLSNLGTVTPFPQAFAGFTGNNDTSGPDGVLTANNHTELWVGDNGNAGKGPGQLWILDASNPSTLITKNPATGNAIANPIPINNPITGKPSTTRADELCYDPNDNLIMIASPAENTNDANPTLSAPFVSFISTKGTKAYTVVAQLVFDGKNAPQASNGLEQCGWSSTTGKFFQNVPEISGAGNDTSPGGVAVIDPKSVLAGSPKVERTFPVPIAECAGPQGMAIGPHNQILLGCNAKSPNGHRNSLVINQHTGAVLRVLRDQGGADEVWFNEKDFHYIIPNCNQACRTPAGKATGPAELVGVVDANGLRRDQSVVVATQNSDTTPFPPPPNPRTIHSAAAFDANIFLPIPACSGSTAATCGGAPHFSPTLCDTRGPGITVSGNPSTATGCIVVLSTTNDDRSRVARERGEDDRQQ